MRKNSILVLGIVAILATSSLSGCGIKTDTPLIGKIAGLEKNEIFKIDDLICSKAEYMLIFMNLQNEYKESMGDGIAWNAKVEDDTTFEDVLRNQAKEEISVRYTMASMAKKNGIKLSENETLLISEAAEKFYNSMSEAEKKYTGASKSDIEKLYKNYYLANKQENAITQNIGNDVSDEQARVVKAQYIHMSTSKTKAKKIKSTLKDVIAVVEGGYQEFSREAKQYSIDESIEFVIDKNEAKKPYEIEAFQLNTGKLSDIIEDHGEYYLVYCIDSYMKKETESNRQEIVDTEKNQAVYEKYNNYLDELSSDFNTAVWKKIEVSNNADVKTTELMKYFDEIES